MDSARPAVEANEAGSLGPRAGDSPFRIRTADERNPELLLRTLNYGN